MNSSNFSSVSTNQSYSSSAVFYTSDKIARIVSSTLVFLLGLIGNVLVVIVIKNKLRRTTNDFFIVNLAIADLLMILELPWSFYLEFTTFPFNSFYCKVIYSVSTFCLNLGIFTLTSMALERWYTFAFRPMQVDGLGQRSAFLWIALLWLSAFACVLPLVIVVRPGLEFCQEDWPSLDHRRAYTVSLVVLQYLLPLAIIAISYIKIAKCLMRSSAGRGVVDKEGRMRIETNRKENILVIKTLTAIVILFAILMFPLQLAWLLYEFGPSERQHVALEMFKYVPIPVYVHSCVNPLVYGTLRKQFRQAYAKYLFFVCRPFGKKCCRTETNISPDSSIAATKTTSAGVVGMQASLMELHTNFGMRSSSYDLQCKT